MVFMGFVCFPNFPPLIFVFYFVAGPEKEVKFVIVGEKAKAIMFRDSKNHISLTVTELNKNPLNYAQVRSYLLLARSRTMY